MCKSGIYRITNLINNKSYVGSSTDIKRRWTVHKVGLRKNKHHSIKLQNAWNKYGEENFEFEILEFCLVEKIVEREQFYIDLLNPLYNVRQIVDSNRGVKRSDQQKQYLSNLYKGKKRSRESIERQKKSLKSYIKTPEHLAKIRLSNLGKKKSRQQCLNQSQPIIILDTLTQQQTEFESIKAIAQYFKTTSPYICVKIKEEKLIRNRYLINRKTDKSCTLQSLLK